VTTTKEWARTLLVLVAIAFMLLVGIAVQRARSRAHQQVPTPPILTPRWPRSNLTTYPWPSRMGRRSDERREGSWIHSQAGSGRLWGCGTRRDRVAATASCGGPSAAWRRIHGRHCVGWSRSQV